MKTFKRGIFLLVLSTVVSAQTGGNFAIKKSVIASGGGNSTGWSFAISGTVGQVDASNELTGGGFQLTGGFWVQQTIPQPDNMFKDGFE